MQEHQQLSDSEITEDLTAPVIRSARWFWSFVGSLGFIMLVGISGYIYELYSGLGVTGVQRPVYWGAYITNFVFWIGISHAGIMVSAILRLTQAEWKRPITRAAEVLTLFSLIAALSNILFHVGRPWRIYWITPLPPIFIGFDFARGIWPNVRSPFVWDPVAVGTYLLSTILFVYTCLIPDIALVRDKVKSGPAKIVYSILALGFRGTPRQWKVQATAPILLSALVLPIFVSVHSIVSWDFAVSIAVEGWHSTIFAPYFIIGAIHSGVSGVVTLMAGLLWLYKLDKYIKPDHFDAIGRLLVVVATIWFFALFLEWIYALYPLEDPEIALRNMQVSQPPWSYLFIVFLLTGFFIPVSAWLFKSVRRNPMWMFFTTILVNIGMWLERFLIIVPGLSRRTELSFNWGSYAPSLVEIGLVAFTFAFVICGIIVFARIFPLIPPFDIKEGMRFRHVIKIGKKNISAVVRE
jgi:molybdopterin-containing oxidoreductase family membrane subunit